MHRPAVCGVALFPRSSRFRQRPDRHRRAAPPPRNSTPGRSTGPRVGGRIRGNAAISMSSTSRTSRQVRSSGAAAGVRWAASRPAAGPRSDTPQRADPDGGRVQPPASSRCGEAGRAERRAGRWPERRRQHHPEDVPAGPQNQAVPPDQFGEGRLVAVGRVPAKEFSIRWVSAGRRVGVRGEAEQAGGVTVGLPRDRST